MRAATESRHFSCFSPQKKIVGSQWGWKWCCKELQRSRYRYARSHSLLRRSQSQFASVDVRRSKKQARARTHTHTHRETPGCVSTVLDRGDSAADWYCIRRRLGLEREDAAAWRVDARPVCCDLHRADGSSLTRKQALAFRVALVAAEETVSVCNIGGRGNNAAPLLPCQLLLYEALS